MKYTPPLQSATLLKRYKRFLADLELSDGSTFTAHCANTGKMTGCADAGFNAFYSTSSNTKRKYPQSLELTQNNLSHARKAAIARLYALGVSRKKLMAMVIGQIVVLVAFTLVIALPLGAMVGYVLTDIVTLRAFGWSLNYVWNWSDAFSIAAITILVAVFATLIPLWRLVSKPVVSSLQSEVL